MRRANEPQRVLELAWRHGEDQDPVGFPPEALAQSPDEPLVSDARVARPHGIGKQARVPVGAQQGDRPIAMCSTGDVQDDDSRHHGMR